MFIPCNRSQKSEVLTTGWHLLSATGALHAPWTFQGIDPSVHEIDIHIEVLASDGDGIMSLALQL